MQAIQPDYARYLELNKLLREKDRQRKSLLAEQKSLHPLAIKRRSEIKSELAALIEEMEEPRSERDMLITWFGQSDAERMKAVKRQLDAMAANKTGLETVAAKASESLDTEVQKYHALQEQAEAVDADELHAARMELRDGMNEKVREKIRDTFGKNYDYNRFRQADREVSELLGEPHPQQDRFITRKLQRMQEQPAAQPASTNMKWNYEKGFAYEKYHQP